MVDWNKQPRSAVEQAAAAGDEAAQAALRMHQSLDRLDATIENVRTKAQAGFDSLSHELDDLRTRVQR